MEELTTKQGVSNAKTTIYDCKLIEKKSYFYGKPEITDGKCAGYIKSKKTNDVLSQCKKCKFFKDHS